MKKIPYDRGGLWKQLEKSYPEKRKTSFTLDNFRNKLYKFFADNEYKEGERKMVMATGEGGIRNIIEQHGVPMFLEMVKNGNLIFYGNWNWTIHNRLEHDVKNYTIFEEKFGGLKKSTDI